MEQEVEQEEEANLKIMNYVHEVANAIREGNTILQESNTILERAYQREYTGDEIYNELERMDLEPDDIASALIFLADNPKQARLLFSSPLTIRMKVVDETDRLLRESYQSWLPTVLQYTSPSVDGPFSSASISFSSTFGSLKTTRRVGVERGFNNKPHPRLVKMVLSATLTQDPSKLAQLDLHHPLFLTTGKIRYQLPEHLTFFKLICEPKLKPLYLVALLQSLQGEKRSIVFTSSVESTHRLCSLLKFFGDLGIKIKEYSDHQHQTVRSKTLRTFREGGIQVLVSSDAMTCGMDVEGVRNVINYDKPPYIKTYIHRAGRTARGGNSGRCFTLLHEDEVKQFKKLLKKADIDSCPVHTVPSDSIESLWSTYDAALEKLKESVETETQKKRKIGYKSSSKMKR